MKGKIDRGLKKLITYTAFILIGVFGLLLLGSDKLIPDIPIKNMNIDKMNTELETKVDEIRQMNKNLEEIRAKKPELIKNAEKLAENPIFITNDNNNKIVDIPSIFVYLEQIGKDTGILVKSIEFVSQDAVGSIPSNNALNKGGGRQLLVSGKGSYQSIVKYLQKIEFKTVEKINIEGLEITFSEKEINSYDMELKISL